MDDIDIEGEGSGLHKSSDVKQGSNIHYAIDGKLLCSYSKKKCLQRRMENYGYCIKHILEDPSSPFQRCQYISKQTSNQCTNPVSTKESDPRYCAAHKQILGLVPKKNVLKRKKHSGEAKKLSKILAKQNIMPTTDTSTASSRGDSDSSSSIQEEEDDVELLISSEEDIDGDADLISDNNFSFPDQTILPVTDYLSSTQVLTQEEFILLRKHKIESLLKLYKMQYVRLQDILKFNYNNFLKNPSSANKKRRTNAKQSLSHKYPCSLEDCPAACTPPSRYCFAHLLKDEKQKLFQACTYKPLNEEQQQCGYPVLINSESSMCLAHADIVQSSPNKKPSSGSKKRARPPVSSPSPRPNTDDDSASAISSLDVNADQRNTDLNRVGSGLSPMLNTPSTVQTPNSTYTLPPPPLPIENTVESTVEPSQSPEQSDPLVPKKMTDSAPGST